MADSDTPRTQARGPYAKSKAVRERILDACLEVFSESGYGASTFKRVAERAGISQRGLLHHFGSKEELLMAALRTHEHLPPEALPPAGSPEGVEAIVGVALATSPKRGIVELHTLISAEATVTSHPAHKHYRDRYDVLRLYLAESFATLQAEGRVTSPISAPVLASMLIALLDGLQLQGLYSPESVDLPATIAAFFAEIGLTLRPVDSAVNS